MQCVHEGLEGVLVGCGGVVDIAIGTVATAPWSEGKEGEAYSLRSHCGRIEDYISKTVMSK